MKKLFLALLLITATQAAFSQSNDESTGNHPPKKSQAELRDSQDVDGYRHGYGYGYGYGYSYGAARYTCDTLGQPYGDPYGPVYRSRLWSVVRNNDRNSESYLFNQCRYDVCRFQQNGQFIVSGNYYGTRAFPVRCW